jgi:hypothetical protein
VGAWQPDHDGIMLSVHVLDLFRRSPYVTNSSAHTFLNALAFLEGPANLLGAHGTMGAARGKVLLRRPDAQFPSMKAKLQHFATARFDAPVELYLGGGRLIVHGENYPQGMMRPVLRAGEYYLQAFRLALAEDARQGTRAATNKLFHDLCDAACLEAKTMTLQAFVERQSDTALTPNLEGKITDHDKVSEYLRVFLEEKKRAFARDLGADLPDHVDVRTAYPVFNEIYFNTGTFSHFLRGYGFFQDKTPAQIQALLDYQVDVLCTIEPPPGPRQSGPP